MTSPTFPTRPHGPRARYVKGCRCDECRAANTAYYHERKGKPWNGLVDAAPARRHLLALSRRGVGYKQAADAAGVAPSIAFKIRQGARKRIRKATADRILEVDIGAAADHAIVPAGRTQRLLRELEGEFFTKAEVARQLGSKARQPALQVGRKRVLVRTQARVERLHRQATGA